MKLLRGAIAVALGSWVGIEVGRALAAQFHYASWAVVIFGLLGAVFGGSTAGVGTDVSHFWTGLNRAWQNVIDWKPAPGDWQSCRHFFFAFLAASFPICFSVAFALTNGFVMNPMRVSFVASAIMAVLVSILGGFAVGFDGAEQFNKATLSQESWVDGLTLEKYLNERLPPWYKFNLFYGLYILLRWTVPRIPWAVVRGVRLVVVFLFFVTSVAWEFILG